ncbi:MAG: hypothetical protein ABW065_01505 [Solirubrobacterales bacterium]
MSGVGESLLRANPGYELVPMDRLGSAERQLLAELGEGDAYGLLRPRAGTSLEARTASADTALLFLTLAEPAPLPSYVRRRLGGEAEAVAVRLVLDGVLELADGDRHVSGPTAAALLTGATSPRAGGRIGALSAAALRYGELLGPVAEHELAMRLYFYGRQPLTTALRERWDERSVAAHLGIDRVGAAREALDAGWVEERATEERHYWRSWRPRRPAGARDDRRANYKLYVSPTVEALPEAFAVVAEELPAVPGIAAFKVGRDAGGICRPDKLVAYFDRLEDLRQAAARLGQRLAGCQAHGIPFTAAIGEDGLLSWGTDPPRSLTGGGSWRIWLAERLAEYLLRAGRDGREAGEPSRFALGRLQLAGVDTDTWAPTAALWPAVQTGA